MTFAPLQSQEDRELAQALQVQGMPDAERAQWFANEWGRVQRRSRLFRAQMPPRLPTTRSFATPDEKNAFDEAREIEFAVRYSVFSVSLKASQREATRT